MKAMLDSRFNAKGFNRNQWEDRWIRSQGISKAVLFEDPTEAAYKFVSAACREIPQPLKKMEGNVIGEWTPGQISTEWKTIEYRIDTALVSKLKGVRFMFTKGNHMLRIKQVELVCDGNVAAVEKHAGSTGDRHIRNTYRLKIPAGTTANNGAMIRVTVRSDGGTTSYGSIEAIVEE
jgi:alpha-N-acetylglucosaminidase